MSKLLSPQNLEEVCAYLELCVEEAKDKAWGEGISFALCFIKKLLQSAQSEIIYCRNCKKYETKFCAMDIWTDQVTIRRVKSDDYCSYAERREE